MEKSGHMLKGGMVVDAAIINAPSSTKNAQKIRDPEMHQTKEGNEWRFGMPYWSGCIQWPCPYHYRHSRKRTRHH